MDINEHIDFNAPPWSPDEDLNLIFLVRENLTWEKISEEMMRSPDRCQQRFSQYFENQQASLDSIVRPLPQTLAGIAAQNLQFPPTRCNGHRRKISSSLSK